MVPRSPTTSAITAAAASGTTTIHQRRALGARPPGPVVEVDGAPAPAASMRDHTPRSTLDHARSDIGSTGGGPRRWLSVMTHLLGTLQGTPRERRPWQRAASARAALATHGS